MLTLSDEHKDAIRAHGERGYPEEICGFLIGQASGDDKAIVRLLPIENVWDETDEDEAPEFAEEGSTAAVPMTRRRRFKVSPGDFDRAEREAQGNGQTIVGFYHSHPDHPARPSDYDRTHAWPWYSYIIVAIHGGMAVDLTSWVLQGELGDLDAQFVAEEILPEVALPGG